MKPILSHRHYFAPDVLEAEKKRLFHQVWQFIGFTDDVAEDGDFVTREVGGHSVVIQNFGQRLCAFHNVCAHRFNRIHTASKGNGPLKCGYHGWTYDGDGVPRVIPKRSLFGADFNPQAPENCLRQWKLETCGRFVFVNRNPDADSLETFLGASTHSRLRELSQALGTRLSFFQKDVEANWKLSVENVLEGYHQPFVHSQTLQALETPITTFEFEGIHSTLKTVPSQETSRDQLRARKSERVIEYCFHSRPLREAGFSHLCVFPNFFIGAARGVTFYTHDVQPLSATTSRLTVSIWCTRVNEEPNDSQKTAMELLCQQATVFWETVFAEDFPVLENVQKALQETELSGALCDEERRIHSFHQVYLSFVAGASDTPPQMATV